MAFTRRAGAGRRPHASLSVLLNSFPDVIPDDPSLEGACPEPDVATVSSSDALKESCGARSSIQGLPVDGSGEWGAADAWRGACRSACTALVFGREESGLAEAEVSLCSHACAIPIGRLQPSMNLSHAVRTPLGDLSDDLLAKVLQGAQCAHCVGLSDPGLTEYRLQASNLNIRCAPTARR